MTGVVGNTTVQYVGMKETDFTIGTNGDCNGFYDRLVMEAEEAPQRPTSDLRHEVLMELAQDHVVNNKSPESLEHASATAAVERAKERRRIVIVMHRITQILLYVLPTIIVLCLILYWTVDSENTKWLTMMAAVLGVACVIDFILFQYFTNRVEGTDLLNTVARFRARLNKSGRRF